MTNTEGTESLKLKPEDIRVDTYVNANIGLLTKPDNGVRLMHIPTGLSVECNSERSQYYNRQKALKELENLVIKAVKDKV